MLIEFSVENFRSIKEKTSLNLKASKKYSSEELIDNVTEENGNHYNISCLKSCVIFGGNAAGKSNLLNALKALSYLVQKSSKFKLDKTIPPYEPFKLCKDCRSQDVSMTAEFIAKDGIRYIYEIRFNKERFNYESLHFYPKVNKPRKTLLYKEENNKIKFGTYYEGPTEFNKYNNQLILSQIGTTPAKSLIEPFKFFDKYLFCSTIHDTRYDDSIIRTYSHLLVDDRSYMKSNINKIIRAADTEIVEIRTKTNEESDFDFPEELTDEEKKKIVNKYRHRIKAVHNLFKDDKIVGEEVFDIMDESTGTRKLVVVGSLILDALIDGTTIIIDELDKSLHPLLTQMLIKLFNSTENNPHNAQLIFASHDISLITRELFRLDQLFFVDKNYQGCSKYFRLSELKNLSRVAPLAKWYMLGRFGATPHINEFELSLKFEE